MNFLVMLVIATKSWSIVKILVLIENQSITEKKIAEISVNDFRNQKANT